MKPTAHPHVASFRRAFTLLEVMIALAIFFMAIFAILDLTSRNLKAARSLKPVKIDASSILGELSLTNRLYEGFESGDFGRVFPGYKWAREITEVNTNGLFQVEFAVISTEDGHVSQSKTTVLLYRPMSPPGKRAGR